MYLLKKVSLSKAAELLDCSRQTVDTLVKKGLIKRYYLNEGGKPYFDIQELNEAFDKAAEMQK